MTDAFILSLKIARGVDGCAFAIRRRVVAESVADLADVEAFEDFATVRDGDESRAAWRSWARDSCATHAPNWREWRWRVASAAIGGVDPEDVDAELAEYVAEQLNERLSDEAEDLVETVGRLAYRRAREDGCDDGEADLVARGRMDEAAETVWRIVADSVFEETEAISTTLDTIRATRRPTPTLTPLVARAPRLARASYRRRPRARRSRRHRGRARSPGRSTGDDDPPSRPPLTRRRKARA